MRVDDLLRLDAGLSRYAALPEMDPLTEEDALQEAQLLDVRLDARTGVVGVLFELRSALQLREGNTGVLVASGVREVAWAGPRRDTALTAWSVGSSVPGPRNGLFGLSLVLWPHPGARLQVTSEAAAFFVGQVPGLPEVPPDYLDLGPTQLADEVAHWGSTFVPLGAAFLDVAPAI